MHDGYDDLLQAISERRVALQLEDLLVGLGKTTRAAEKVAHRVVQTAKRRLAGQTDEQIASELGVKERTLHRDGQLVDQAARARAAGVTA
jgi:hypothetical protein